MLADCCTTTNDVSLPDTDCVVEIVFVNMLPLAGHGWKSHVENLDLRSITQSQSIESFMLTRPRISVMYVTLHLRQKETFNPASKDYTCNVMFLQYNEYPKQFHCNYI